MADAFFHERVFPDEVHEIRARREAVGQPTDGLQPEPRVDNELVGLAISGGGVRSASFALGVVQALASVGLLKRVDLLCTVSGGGFLGSCISALLHGGPGGTGPDDFPLAHRPNAEEPAALAHVRAHSAYLTPDGAIDQVRIPALLLRGIIVNVVTVLPLVLMAVLATWFAYQPAPALEELICGTLDSRPRLGSAVLVGQACDERVWTMAATLMAASGILLFVALAVVYPIILRALGRRFRWEARNQLSRLTGVVLAFGVLAALAVPLFGLTHAAILTTFDQLLSDAQTLVLHAAHPTVAGIVLGVIVSVGIAARQIPLVARALREVAMYAAGLAGPAIVLGLYLVLCVVTIKPPYVHAAVVIDELRSGRVGPRLDTVLSDRGVPDAYGRRVRSDPRRWAVAVPGGVLDIQAQHLWARPKTDGLEVRDARPAVSSDESCATATLLPRRALRWYLADPDGLVRVDYQHGGMSVVRVPAAGQETVRADPVGLDCDSMALEGWSDQLRIHGEEGASLHGVVDGSVAQNVINSMVAVGDLATLEALLGLPRSAVVGVPQTVDGVWRTTALASDADALDIRLVHECWRPRASVPSPREIDRSLVPAVNCELARGSVGPKSAAALQVPLGIVADGVLDAVPDGPELGIARDRIRVLGPEDQHTFLVGEVATRALTELRAGRIGDELRAVLSRGNIEVPEGMVADPHWLLPGTTAFPDEVRIYRSGGRLVHLERAVAGSTDTAPLHRSLGMLSLMLTAGLLTSVWLLYDVNLTSLHRFYRDRLSKAWLVTRAPDGAVAHVDDLRLSQLRGPGSAAPYHIVQAAVNTADREPALHGRAADFFVFTKRWIGGPLAGWCATDRLERIDRRLDLGTAMAISGAAAAPQMGTETLRPLAFVMTLLNVRMGYWLPNPSMAREHHPWLRVLFQAGPGPLYLLYEALGLVSLQRSHVFATDGGHIENLGVHELLRRKCRLIVAIDGEEDPDRICPSLLNVVRYARMDLGIEIDIPVGAIRRGADGLSERNWAVGTIRYAPDEIGVLLVIKATLTGREPDDVLDERRLDPTFPHVSTADQFFTPQRFEAYRSLGLWTGITALSEAAETAAGPLLTTSATR